MKTIFKVAFIQSGIKLIAAFVCMTLLEGCHLFEPVKKIKEPKKCLVVVKDVSASIVESDADIEKQKLWIKRYLKEHYIAQMDIVILEVNSSTSSAVNHKELLWQQNQSTTPNLYQSETDKMLSENKEKMDNSIQFRKNQKKLLLILFENSETTPSNQTQIIELIPQFDRISKSYYDTLQIILLTDALQESKLRSFSKTMPTSKTQAEEFAREDCQKILASYTLHPNVLKKVESIQVLVPPKTSPETLVTIPYYYQEFFSRFGYLKTVNWASF